MPFRPIGSPNQTRLPKSYDKEGADRGRKRRPSDSGSMIARQDARRSRSRHDDVISETAEDPSDDKEGVQWKEAHDDDDMASDQEDGEEEAEQESDEDESEEEFGEESVSSDLDELEEEDDEDFRVNTGRQTGSRRRARRNPSEDESDDDEEYHPCSSPIEFQDDPRDEDYTGPKASKTRRRQPSPPRDKVQQADIEGIASLRVNKSLYPGKSMAKTMPWGLFVLAES